MKNINNIIIKPLISEKSYAEANFDNKYTFVVGRYATKTDIKNAIEELFGVDVRKVYTANIKGSKTRNTRFGKKTLDDSYKKARVLLPKGQKIGIFEEAVKEEAKKEKKQKKGEKSS